MSITTTASHHETSTTAGVCTGPLQVKRLLTPLHRFLMILNTTVNREHVPSPGAVIPAPLAAAAGALVLLDVLCLGRGDADALAVEPLLTDVTADPELAVCIALPTGATKVCLVLLFRVLPATVLLLFWVSRLRRLAVRVGLF